MVWTYSFSFSFGQKVIIWSYCAFLDCYCSNCWQNNGASEFVRVRICVSYISSIFTSIYFTSPFLQAFLVCFAFKHWTGIDATQWTMNQCLMLCKNNYNTRTQSLLMTTLNFWFHFSTAIKCVEIYNYKWVLYATKICDNKTNEIYRAIVTMRKYGVWIFACNKNSVLVDSMQMDSNKNLQKNCVHFKPNLYSFTTC